jgi:hypothetical protein
MHVADDGQAMEMSEPDDPLGGVSAVQMLPPSLVATMPGPDVFVSEPTAVQEVVEVQATASRSSPAGTVSAAQVVPPSVVPMIVPPLTAVQSEVDGHDSWPPVPNPVGTAWSCHVVPPLVVPRISGLPEVVAPSASQTDVEAHEIAPSAPASAGRLCSVHVAPPSAELTTAPGPVSPKPAKPPSAPPTAVQMDVVGHETASRSSTP